MPRRPSKRVALAATSTLLLLLYLSATNSNNRALLSTGHGSATRATSGGDARGGKGGEWPESWGREIGFRPGVRLPNLGRTPAGWEGVRSDAGARSPFYGDVQRRHQDWLLRRAEEIRFGSNEGGGGGGDGGGDSGEEAVSIGRKTGENVVGGTPTGQEAQEGVQPTTAAEQEGGGGGKGERGQVVGTRYEGDGAETVDSEDWARIGSGVGPDQDQDVGTESSEVETAVWDVPDSVGPAAARDAKNNPEAGTRRLARLRLRRHQQEELRGRQRRRQMGGGTASLASDKGEGVAGGENASAIAATVAAENTARRITAAVGWGWGWSGHVAESDTAIKNKERIRRLERGAELWGGTYAPPIEPQRRQELIDKWSEAGKRVLYVITSFDRGKRLGRNYNQIDKLDYILMMMDEMREACELGFSPQVHLIAAWDPSEVSALVEERLFCQRTDKHVPFSYEEHPPSVRNNLAIKHRIYMRSRVQDFDVFLQVEDDMIFTLNHILLYREECDFLENRKGVGGSRGRPNVLLPGFMRVESDGNDWVEWEVALSRFRALKIFGAGIYMALRPSKVLPRGGNNQGLWIATREQLVRMVQAEGCRYLDFDESSTNGMPETHSGSIQMFHSECGFEKVFPATHFEDFIVHHRTNNKNGRRGESIPGVSMVMLRVWAEQFIRDENFLEVRHWTVPAQP
eukprot:g7997.t1